ncbi:mating-type alpha-pheromone receptor PreB [Phyllosticta capitalensis]
MADSVSDASQAFDPFSQTVVFRTADGEKIPVPLEELNIFAQYAIQICINYATQIGASAILLALLLVMTPHDKRRSPIFIFNTVSLVINILRNVFQCLYYTGSFWNVYSFVTFDYSIVKSTDVAYSVTATILTLTLLICIQTSLVLQVQVVCVTVSKAFRYALVLLSSIVALATIGVRFALTVVNVQSILGVVTMGEWTFLASSSNIILSCSICFFSLIFTGKLAFAIRNRRKLGMKQFGPMQIIFVMGCNTLIVPAIVSILAYASSGLMLGSLVLTLVALFLPLSAIWASAHVERNDIASRGRDAHHRLFGSFGFKRDRNPSAVSESTSTAPLKGPTMSQKTADSETTQVDLEVGNETHVYGTHYTTTRLRTISEHSGEVDPLTVVPGK